jgi:hypothetical protein
MRIRRDLVKAGDVGQAGDGGAIVAGEEELIGNGDLSGGLVQLQGNHPGLQVR